MGTLHTYCIYMYSTVHILCVLYIIGFDMFEMFSRSCKECSIMTLGTYDKNPTYAGSSRKVYIYIIIIYTSLYHYPRNKAQVNASVRCSEVTHTGQEGASIML